MRRFIDRLVVLPVLALVFIFFAPNALAVRTAGADLTDGTRKIKSERRSVSSTHVSSPTLLPGSAVQLILEGGNAIAGKIIDRVEKDDGSIQYRLGDSEGNPLPEEKIKEIRRVDASGGDLLIAAITGDPSELFVELIRMAQLGLKDVFNSAKWETVDIWQSQQLHGTAVIAGERHYVSFRVQVGNPGTGSSGVLVRLDQLSVQPRDVEFDVPVIVDIGLDFGPLELRTEVAWPSFTDPSFIWIKEIQGWREIEDQLRNNPIRGKIFVRKDPWAWFDKRIGTIDLFTGGTTFPPARPQLSSASNQNSVSLSFKGSGASFEVYRSEQSDFSIDGRDPITTVSGDSYEDTSVLPGKRYFYKVVAVSSGGQKSNPSKEVTGRARTEYRFKNLSVGATPIRAHSQRQLSGRLETTEGEPVTNANISATIPEVDWTYEGMTTDGSGNFQLTYRLPVNTGNYTLRLSARTKTSTRVKRVPLSVQAAPDAGRDIKLSEVAVSDSLLQSGGTFQATVDLENAGDQDEEVRLTYQILDRDDSALTTVRKDVSIGNSVTTRVSKSITVPTDLAKGNYVLRITATNGDGLDLRPADNSIHQDLYVGKETAPTPTYQTSQDTIRNLEESINISGTSVTLLDFSETSASFDVGGEATGSVPIDSLWRNDSNGFLLIPKEIRGTDTTIVVRGGSTTGQAGVTPNLEIVKRDHQGSFQVSTPDGTNLSLSSMTVVSGRDQETLNSWSSNVQDQKLQTEIAEFNLLVPSTAEIRRYSGWLRWADESSLYYRKVELRAAPIHDLQLADLKIDNGVSVNTLLPGMDIEISGTATNVGDFTEAKDVEIKVKKEGRVVYTEYNSIQLAKRSNPQEIGGQKPFSITWPTVGLEKGEYNIVVSYLHNEDETPNNNRLTATAELTEPQPLSVDILEFPKVYEAGDSVEIRASVEQQGSSVSGASVSALVTKPDGEIEEVDLQYNPSKSLYEGIIFADLGGNYDVKATAEQQFSKPGSDQATARTYVDVALSSSFPSLLLSRKGAVQIRVGNVGGLYSFSADVTYDESKVNFEEAREESFLDRGGKVQTSMLHSDEGGRVITGVTRTEPDAGGATTVHERPILSLSFTGVSEGTTSFGMENLQLTDAQGDTMASRIVSQPATFQIDSQVASLALNAQDTVSTLFESDTTNLIVTNGYNLKGFEGNVSFDPNEVQVEDVIEGPAFQKDGTETLFVENIDNGKGKVELGVSRTGEENGTSTGSSRAVRLIYKPLAKGQTQFNWSNTELIAAEKNLGLPHTSSGETIFVKGKGESSDTATVSFSPALVDTSEGSEISFAVTVEDVTNLFSVAADIGYDPSQLDFKEITEGRFLSEDGQVGTSFTHQIDESNGTITIGLSRLGTEVGGVSTVDPDTLFTVKLERTGDDRSNLDLYNTGLILPDGSTEIPSKQESAILKGTADITFIDGRNDSNGGESYSPPPPSPGTTDNPVGRFQLSAHQIGSMLSEVGINMGVASVDGIESVELWRSKDNQFNSSNDTLVDSVNYSSEIIFSDIKKNSIPTDTISFFAVVDLSSSAQGDVDPLILSDEEIAFVDGVLKNVNSTQKSNFSDAFLSISSSKLPVELSEFEAKSNAQKIYLAWTTASESNSAGFAVQHRADTTGQWEKLGFLESKAEGGTTTKPQEYRFQTEQLNVGVHQFRLRQVDLDGTAQPSDPITAKVTMEEAYRLTSYPNPIRQQATVDLAAREKQEVQLLLYDVLGRQVATLHDGPVPAQETKTLTLDAGEEGLSSGTYFLRLIGQDGTRTRRLTIVR